MAWNHTKVPTWVRGRMSPYGLAVYRVLLDRADGEGRAWPSHATIAEEAGCSPRSVASALEWLRVHGVISWVQRTDSKGQTSNLYTVWRDLDCAPAEFSGCTSCKHHLAPRASTPLQEVQTKENQENENQENENQVSRSTGAVDAPAPRATEKQIEMLRDQHILGGGTDFALDATVEFFASLSLTEAKERIEEAYRELPRGGDYLGPVAGEAMYDLLSADGKRWADAAGIPSVMEPRR